MSPRAASATAAPTDHTGAQAPGRRVPPWGRLRGRAAAGGPGAGGFPADVAGSGGGEVVAEVVGLLE
ncbi:hypothetical protein STENM327S_09358 [Streptomyces tendae]